MSFDKIVGSLGLTLIVAAFWAVCFLPATFMFTRVENLLLPLLVLFFAASRQIRIELPIVAALSGFFIFFVATIFLNGEGMGEVSFAFRTLKILLFIVLASQLLQDHLPSFDKVLRITFLIIGSITMLEFFNPRDINSVLFDFFTHHSVEQFIKLDSTRLIG